MEDYFDRQAELEAVLNFRYPWFNMMYKWIIAALLVALCVSFVWWGLDIRTRRMADEMTATAMASYQAEQQAAEDARALELEMARQSEEHVMTVEAQAVARAFYGIRNFVEKYGYTSEDLETYARCIFNRADASGASVEDVVSKKDQFLGYSDGNQLVKEYYDLAIRLVDEWHHEDVKPCDTSYQWAELTPDGIFLRNSFKADGYARRYHA